ncbi:MAG TPA: L-2-amino-thiazoline-4-carboxylic acid hydrolase [Dehalococcoidia bacterium]|nr:L-2-amino-thiazoline-4-carboxylic acid hydrolase [Dehalococcoidia bacterium]
MENQKIDFADCIDLMKQSDYRHIRNLVSYLRALKNSFGDDVAKIVEDISCKDAFNRYKNLAIDQEDRTIEKLISILWGERPIPGLHQYTYKKENDGFQFNCTVCPYVDMFKKLDATEWGYRLYCALDPPLVEGFNENIGFRRTKTLMEGHDCCDHFYYYLK